MGTFIIGTGRCGSTLLSDLLHLHPEALVLSEFLKGFDPWLHFDGEPRSGACFAEQLAAPNFTIDILLHRACVPPEILHGLQGVDLATLSLPKLFVATLPTLSDDPAALLAESVAFAAALPTQPMASHFLAYIEWLRQRLGKRLWIERSGASIEILRDMRLMFPDANYVHIHRDGAEAALSMRAHAYFQLYVSLWKSPLTAAEFERTEFAGQPIGADDPFTRRMTTELPSVADYGAFWSQQIATGFHELQHIDPARVLHVRFEDVVRDTAATLPRIAAHIGLPDNADWLRAAAAHVKSDTAARGLSLPDTERRALEHACRPGQLLLGREQWHGIDTTMELLRERTQDGAAR